MSCLQADGYTECSEHFATVRCYHWWRTACV